ncbi:MAG: toll/interleukin-1 receptor domain-containing protein [Phycisphaerales bacterium]|nr:MAG: toll/interleukin-1 receptor domain-containing protein [Phycisphaerales bacterium]
MDYDLFISHASEDKTAFVRPLSEHLRRERYQIWYDEFELKVGDSLTEKIDYGLSNSRAGIVVLSNHFFQKKWPRRELAGMSAKQVHQNTKLIPIWHGVTVDEVITSSPPLADIKALDSTQGLDKITEEVKKVILPSQRDLWADTIEEASELLERGSYDSAHTMAARAFDQ